MSFPVFSRIGVNGPGRHPFYAALIAAMPAALQKSEGGMREVLARHGLPTGDAGDVVWNFEKFLVSRQGCVIGRFAPDITVDDAPLRDAIRTALAAAPQV